MPRLQEMSNISFPQASSVAELSPGVFSKCRRTFEFARQRRLIPRYDSAKPRPGSRTLLTEIDIPNPDGVLAAGIYCTVELHIPRKVLSLSIPAGAIIFNANGVQVAVVENGVARLRKITVARDLGTEVEALDGVKSGDQVILNPSVDLVDGAKVQVRPSPS